MQVSSKTVADGLYEWMTANRWFIQDDVDAADLTAEKAAQHALLLLCKQDHDGYRALPKGVRALTMRFFLSFFEQVMRGPMAKEVWNVTPSAGSSATSVEKAWLVVEIELRRSMPPSGLPN